MQWTPEPTATNGNDIIVGTDDADAVYELGGDDTLSGGAIGSVDKEELPDLSSRLPALA